MPMNWAMSLVSALAACRSGASLRQGGHQEPQTLITTTLPAIVLRGQRLAAAERRSGDRRQRLALVRRDQGQPLPATSG